MSDVNETTKLSDVDEALAAVAEVAKIEKLKEETAKKQAILNARRVDAQMDQLEQSDKDAEAASKADFSRMSFGMLDRIELDNDEYIEAAKNMLQFIDTNTFGSFIPFFRKNLIFIGAATGDGKSTAVANIAYGLLRMKIKSTGENANKRVLIVTNEEKAEDVLNRLTCLAMGWAYVNHNEFTEVQTKAFKKGIRGWTLDGRVTVVDDTYGESHGVTTTLEGIERMFESLILDYKEKGKVYDSVLIDYYQNIIVSTKNPQLSENQVQERLSRMLDKYKNIYPAPIVLMGQMNKADKDDKTPWKQRIAGRKIIADKCTCVIEMNIVKIALFLSKASL